MKKAVFLWMQWRPIYTKQLKWMTVYLWITSQIYVTSSETGEIRDYCQWESFNATCRTNEVILMKTAKYGRMRLGTCVKEDHGNVGCKSNVRPQLDQKCSGRRSCELEIPHHAFRNILPCPKELMPYLEASYECVPVQSTSLSGCIVSNGLKVVQGTGYLASASLDQGIGTSRCPWIIQAHSGQRINLTLLGFGSDRQTSENSVMSERKDCRIDVVVVESGKRRTMSACDPLSGHRERLLYISDSNRIDVYINSHDPNIETYFLIKYTAIGCPDFIKLKNSWATRTGDTAVVKCNFTGETFFLSCDGSEWKGELGNCTKVTANGTSKKTDEKGSKFPYGLLIVICIGVALGVAFGILMLFGILFCLRRRRVKHVRGHTMDPLLSEHPHEQDDTISNIYDKTRIIRCPHGLAAINLNPDGIYYPEGLERHPQVSLTTVASPYSLEHDDVQGGDMPPRPPPEFKEGIYSHDGKHGQNTLTRNFTTRKNEMQTSFTTFRPNIITEDGREDLAETAYRSLQNKNNENSLDLLRDSRPYRELNPESLECTCSLRQDKSHSCESGDQEKADTRV